MANGEEEQRLRHHVELSEDTLVSLSAQSKSNVRTYQWAILALVGLLTFALGWITNSERLSTTVAVDSHRIQVLEDTYTKSFDKFNDMLVENGTKLDVLATALRDHELGIATKK